MHSTSLLSRLLPLALLTSLPVNGAVLQDGDDDSQSQSRTGPYPPPNSYTFGTPNRDATFDYVVVGGGTAGLVMATRLAQQYNVAVIEAGGYYELDNGNLSTVPGYDVFYAGTDPADTNPLIDWGFVTTPQAGAANRKLHYARGKTLGGSSARNFMFYHRPTVGSLQKWATEVGDNSYTFDNLFSYFKKSVHYTPPFDIYKNSTNTQSPGAFDPNGNPLQVSFGKYEDPLGTWFQRGFQAVGQAAIAGFQIGKLIGSGYMAWSEDPKTAARSSSESSFLENIKSPKLKVYRNTLAEKINFGPAASAQSVCVTPYKNSKPGQQQWTLTAKKEVIVSAGAFQSPQLLMVSGVGPKAQLQQFKIPVVKDLSGVGRNLWDQPFFGTTFQVNLLTNSNVNATLTELAIEAYQKDQAGPLTNPATPVIGWERLSSSYSDKFQPSTQQALNTQFPADWPQLEFLPIGAYIGNASNFVTSDPHNGKNYATLATALITPFSRGTVTLASANMADPPLINPAWLTDPRDKEQAIAALRRQRDVWKAISGITIGKEVLPGANVQSDQDILSYISKNVVPIWHAAATCKMGKSSDPNAVVDTKMRVYGTKNLRVIDASAFPFLTPGHPQSVIYAVAEKAAKDILNGS